MLGGRVGSPHVLGGRVGSPWGGQNWAAAPLPHLSNDRARLALVRAHQDCDGLVQGLWRAAAAGGHMRHAQVLRAHVANALAAGPPHRKLTLAALVVQLADAHNRAPAPVDFVAQVIHRVARGDGTRAKGAAVLTHGWRAAGAGRCHASRAHLAPIASRRRRLAWMPQSCRVTVGTGQHSHGGQQATRQRSAPLGGGAPLRRVGICPGATGRPGGALAAGLHSCMAARAPSM